MSHLVNNHGVVMPIPFHSIYVTPRWRHQMETFSALLAICVGNSPVTGEFPAQKPVTRSFDVFFDLRLNKCLSKQSWSWWFETTSVSLWRHRNVKLLQYRVPVDFIFGRPIYRGMNVPILQIVIGVWQIPQLPRPNKAPNQNHEKGGNL